jgi:thiosulfate/3-mercaptopyruvate sulfurtransferase
MPVDEFNAISMTETALVISPQWLAEHLNDPNITIIDCRFALANPELGQQQYQQSHIPGAFYLDLNQDLSSPVQKHGGRHPLPDVNSLAAKLAKMGVHSGETLIVAYDDSRFAFASRLWWLLRYFGHSPVTLLDGGFSAWQAAGYAVTADSPTVKPGQFTPQLHPEMVVDIDTVRATQDLPNVILIDSREGDRYLGKHEPIDPVAGHIPGAINLPWQQVSDTDGKVKQTEQLQRWSEYNNAEEIIVYCGSGVTACVNLWSMEFAGLKTGKLYAGSWSDWCSYLQ